MFQFPGFASSKGYPVFKLDGLPHSEIYGLAYVRLLVAYRSLSRPSSPLVSKASSICPYLLSRNCKMIVIHKCITFNLNSYLILDIFFLNMSKIDMA